MQKRTSIKSSENDSMHYGNTQQKLSRFNNKSNESLSSSNKNNGPIYGRTTIAQPKAIQTKMLDSNRKIERDETLQIQKRAYRRLQSSNSNINADTKQTLNGDLGIVKPKLTAKSNPPQALKSNAKKFFSTINDSNIIKIASITSSGSSFIPIQPRKTINPIELKLKSHQIDGSHQRFKHSTRNNDKPKQNISNSCKTNEKKLENGIRTLQKSIIQNSHATASNTVLESNEVGKLKKQTLPEKKTKMKGTTKRVTGRRKSVGIAKYLTATNERNTAQNDTTQQTSLQRIPLRSAVNDVTVTQLRQLGKVDVPDVKRMRKEWHAPETYIFDDQDTDDLVDNSDMSAVAQTFWFRDIPNENILTREQRLETKRDNLRRQAFQYAQAQHFRSTILAKKRLIVVTKALAKFKNERNR